MAMFIIDLAELRQCVATRDSSEPLCADLLSKAREAHAAGQVQYGSAGSAFPDSMIARNLSEALDALEELGMVMREDSTDDDAADIVAMCDANGTLLGYGSRETCGGLPHGFHCSSSEGKEA